MISGLTTVFMVGLFFGLFLGAFVGSLMHSRRALFRSMQCND